MYSTPIRSPVTIAWVFVAKSNVFVTNDVVNVEGSNVVGEVYTTALLESHIFAETAGDAPGLPFFLSGTSNCMIVLPLIGLAGLC